MKFKFGNTEVKALTYKFPTKGNQPEDYHLIVNGQKLDTTRVRTTKGGGKEFTYIKLDSQVGGPQSMWVPGIIPSGTQVQIVEEAPKPAPAAPAAATNTPPPPNKPVKQRPQAAAPAAAPAKGKK